MYSDVSRCRLIKVSAGLNLKKRFTSLCAVLGFGNCDSLLIDIKLKRKKEKVKFKDQVKKIFTWPSDCIPTWFLKAVFCLQLKAYHCLPPLT